MEYLLVIFEFLQIKSRRNLVVQILVPIILGICLYKTMDPAISTSILFQFQSSITTILGILIGFTISVFTILLTTENKNIEESKQSFNLQKRLYNKKISLHDSILISLAYLIVIQVIFIVESLLFPWFISSDSIWSRILISLNLSAVVHIILVMLRTVLDIYFILTKRQGSR